VRHILSEFIEKVSVLAFGRGEQGMHLGLRTCRGHPILM